MILYTPLCPEDIFPSWEESGSEKMTARTGSGFVTLCKNGQGDWMVESLQSSDPQDYLDPACQPGEIWK
ncbi:YlzJ-like family protein [Salibacterium sp. K-3]